MKIIENRWKSRKSPKINKKTTEITGNLQKASKTFKTIGKALKTFKIIKNTFEN